jgi:hypothetical protein
MTRVLGLGLEASGAFPAGVRRKNCDSVNIVERYGQNEIGKIDLVS